MKRNHLLAPLPVILAGLLSLLVSSCASVKKGAGETVEWTFPKFLTAPFMDAKTDTTTGALRMKGKAEAEKQVEETESEENAERALREVRRREREEEEKRVHRAITDDIKLEQQTRQT